MQRSYFIDNCDCFEDLLSFAQDEDYNFERLWYKDSFDEYIENELYYRVRDNTCTWVEILDWLDGLPQDYYYIYENDFGEYSDAPDYFDEMFEEFMDWMDEGGYWDEEDDDYECDDDDLSILDVKADEETNDEPVEPGCNLFDLFVSSQSFKTEKLTQSESDEFDAMLKMIIGN